MEFRNPVKQSPTNYSAGRDAASSRALSIIYLYPGTDRYSVLTQALRDQCNAQEIQLQIDEVDMLKGGGPLADTDWRAVTHRIKKGAYDYFLMPLLLERAWDGAVFAQRIYDIIVSDLSIATTTKLFIGAVEDTSGLNRQGVPGQLWRDLQAGRACAQPQATTAAHRACQGSASKEVPMRTFSTIQGLAEVGVLG